MALGVNIVSEFDAKGIKKAISDFQKLEGVGQKSTFGLRTLDSAVSNGLANVAKYGGIAIAGLGAVGGYLLRGAEFAKQADDRLVAVAESMKIFGSNADIVAQRLQKLGDAQEYELGVTAETIKATQAKLLTFGQLAVTANEVGGAFDRATVAAIDLGAAGFGEASQNAIQLGKALQDPIKGITALARSGVTFTDAEKAKIRTLVESNKMLEAQDTLLKAVETQVGGTAKATTTDSFRIASAFGHVRDEIGTLLMPTVEKFANFMVGTVVPFATKAGQEFGEKGFGGGVKFLIGEMDKFITGGGKVTTIITSIIAAIVALKLVTIAATISQTLFNTALLANPIGIAVAALIAFGVAVAAAYIRFEGFRKIVNTVVNAIIGYFEFMTNMWIKAINFVIKGVNLFGGILRAVGINMPKLGQIGEVAFGRIGNAAAKTVAKVKDVSQAIMEAKNIERRLEGMKPGDTGAGGDDDDFVGSGGGGKTVETAREKLTKYLDAIKAVSKAQKDLRESSKGVVEAQNKLGEANRAVTLAQQKFAIVTKGYPRDSKEAQAAIRATADATRDLRKATREQTDSVANLRAAEKALADLRDRKANPRDVADAERKLTRSKFDVEEAAFSLGETERELAEMRKDPNIDPVELRRKEIEYEEAKFRVVEATNAVADAEAQLAAVRDVSPKAEELAAAERTLEDAKIAVEDATLAVADATIKQAVAQAIESEILNGAKEGSEAYEAALKDLNDAKESQRQAIDAVSDALYREAEAIEAVREAEKELAEQRKNTPADIISKAETRFAAMPTQNVAPVGSGSGGATVVNNLTVNAGLGTNPAELRQEIVDLLDEYTRYNGPLGNWIAV
jgi:hypothetical protein